MAERQAEVRTELESVPTAPFEDCQDVTKGSDDAQEEKNITEDHSLSKTDDDDTEREKPVDVSEIRETATSADSLKEEGVENELPSVVAQPEEKTTDSVQVEEKHILGEISKTEEEPEQAICLKDDPVAEKLEISSENISEETGEADPSDIADKTIPHVEEEKTIIEQQTDDSETNANESRASDDTSVELEKSRVSITTRTCPAEDVETEKADAAQVTEEASDLEGVHTVEDSREVDVESADSLTTEVDDKSPDAKTEEASSPSSNTEHLLHQEESKPAKTDIIVEQVNEEPTSTCADDDRLKEQTNMVGHILTGSHGEDVTAPLDDKEENSNKKEISEQVIQEFSKIEEEPEESTQKPEIRIPETSPNSTSEEPGEAVESVHVDDIIITTTGEETDKIEGQGTDSTEFKMNSALAEAEGKTEVAEAEILGEDAETNKEEKTEILEKDGVNKASLTVTADDSGLELPSPAECDLKETSKDEEDSEQPEQINETPEILERAVETPAEIKESASGKDEDIPVSVSEDETVKKVEQIEERHKEHPANDCKTEAVGDTGADVSDATEDEVVTIKEQGSAGSTEVKSGTATDQHLQEDEKQDPIEPTAELVEKEAELTGNFEERVARNGTQLDEPIALESQMQTHGIEEVPARVEQIAETLSQEQMENKVESKPEPNLDDSNSQERVSEPEQDDFEKLKKTSEPDPDDAENPKQVSEPDPEDAENLKQASVDDSENLEKVSEKIQNDSEELKQVAEPDPDDSENLKLVSEPKPDDSENLKKTSEPDPDDAENPKQVSEPDPDECENLEKVSGKVQNDSEELEQVVEPDPDDSETLKQVSEPDPDDSDKLEKVSEPDPDDSESVKKVSGPDPEILKKFSEPDPDDSQNKTIVPEQDPADSENQEKVDITEISEDCNEAKKKEITVSPSEEVRKKSDATPGEPTFSEVSTVSVEDERVSRSIEVIPATDTVPELSVEDSVQEKDHSYHIPETGNEEHKQESAPTQATDDQTTHEQTIKGDAEHDEEPASEETVSTVQQSEAQEEIQTREATEERVTEETEGTEGGSPPADVTIESKKPDEAEEDMEKIASVEQDDAEIPVTAAECNKSHVEEVKEQITEEVSQKDEAGEEASVKENEPGEAVEHLANADDETEPSASSVNDDEVTILNTREAPEDPELSTPSLNDDNISTLKSDETAEEIQEEEKVDVSAEDRETAKGVLVTENEQKDTNVPNETEASARSVNDDNNTSLESKERTEENLEEQQKDDVSAEGKETAKEFLEAEDEQKDTNEADETEDSEPSALSLNDDKITSLKSEKNTEETQEEQEKVDVNDKETAKEVLVLEDEQTEANVPNEIQEEQQRDDVKPAEKETARDALVLEDKQKDTDVPNETEDTEPSASSVNDENITSQKRLESTEEILGEQLKDDARAEDKEETAKEMLVPEDEQKDTNVANETDVTEPSASSVNDDNITRQKSEESTEEILGEQLKDDVNAEERETAKILVPEDEQKDTNVPNETEDTEPSASTVNDDNITSQRSEKNTAEIQEEQDKVGDMVTAKEVLVPEDEQKDANVPNEIEDTEASGTSVNEENITSQKSEESTKEIPEEQQKDNVNAEDREISEVLVAEDEQKDTNAANETEDAEPSASSVNDDNITSLKRLESTEEILGEQQKDDVITEEKETAEVPVPEDEQKDTNVPNETDDTEPSASSVNDDNITSQQRAAENLEEQQNDDVSAENKETAKEVLVPEDEPKNKNVANETEDTEPSALSVNDDNITSQKSEESTEEIQEEKQRDFVEPAEKETAKDVLVQEDEQDTNVPDEAEHTETSDKITSLKSEESTEDTPAEQQKDGVSAKDKDTVVEVLVPEDEQKDKKVSNDTEDAEQPASCVNDGELSLDKGEELHGEVLEKEIDQAKDDDIVEAKQTADEVVVQDEERVQPDQLPNEPKGNEPLLSVSDEDSTILKRDEGVEEVQVEASLENQLEENQNVTENDNKKEATVRQDEQGEEEKVHPPNETEDTRLPASSVDDDSFTTLKTEEVQEEGKDKDQAEDNDNVQDREIALELTEQEDKQEEQLAQLQIETQEAEPSPSPSGPIANDDEIAIPRSHADPETVMETNQVNDDGNATEVETTKEALVQESKGVELEHFPEESGEAEPSIKDESTSVLNSKEEPEEKETDLIRDDMEEKETGQEALRQEDAQPSVADTSDDKTASLKSKGPLEEAPEESNESDHPEPEIEKAKEKDHVDRELVLEDKQGEDAKDEPAASLVNEDDIKTLKSEAIPKEVQEEEKEVKQTEDDGDAKVTEAANEALVVDIPREKGIDLAKEMVEAESPAPNPSADETVILKMEEDPEGVAEEDKKKDQAIDDEVFANELPEQEDEKEDKPEHLPSETEGAELHASSVTDDKKIGVDSGEKTEQGAEELVKRSQEKVDETEEKEPSNEGLESSVDELEAGHEENKTQLESKEPDSVEDNAEKEDSIAEDTSSPGVLEHKVESSIQENEHIKAVHEEAATTNETQVFDKQREAGVEKDIEEETTVPEALAAEAKSSDEDNKGLTQTDIHQDGCDTLESVASVEVSNSEALKDFVTTAKETAEEELESTKPSADEEDKKELTITEAQGGKLPSSEQNEVPVVRDENQDANEPVTTDTDGTILPKSETAEAPAAADEDQVNVIPRETGDEEPHESPALQEADALGDEDQKELITASDEATEKTENESLITSSRECDFQPTDDADEKVDVPSESLTTSSILEEAKSIITGKDTETTPPNEKALVESEDKVEEIAVRESQAKEDDETNVKAHTSAGSNAAEQAAISSLVLEKDDETQMEIEGDLNSESIKVTSSLGLKDATIVTSEVSDESASIVEPVAEDEIATKESHSGSTEEMAVSEGNNPEHLSSEVPKLEVNAAEPVEIKEELLMEEPSLVTTPPGLGEQEDQEKSVHEVTSVAHKAEPDEEIETNQDSADEILSAPVKLLDEPKASREPARDTKVEEVSSTELDKEENKGQIEIQIEAPDSAIPEKLEVKEAQPQETATVTPANDKLEVDQVIKSEASEDPIELAENKGGADPAESVISSTASRDREADFLDEEVVAHQSKSGTVQADDSVAALAVPKQEQASSEATLRAETDAEASPILVSTANKDVPAEIQQSTTRSLDYAEVARPETENAGRGEIESQPKSAEAEKAKTTQETDSKTESAILPVNIPAENSLSDLLQISTKDTIQMAQQPSQETDPAPKKDGPHTEDPKTDEDKDDEEEEGEEQKKTDSNSSDGVIVEGSRDLDIKSPQKKHGILSGVGSKVKNSISKVKKAITGKSSHPKP
uniref:Uncharacterized protein n=1 Tax=Kalanchoe fedtschenkoi TaxID=63787 RepID=A0A7N0U455_KALFE